MDDAELARTVVVGRRELVNIQGTTWVDGAEGLEFEVHTMWSVAMSITLGL